MSTNTLFQQKLQVINIGLEQFQADLSSQNVEVIQLQWRIPTIEDKRVKAILDAFAKLDEEGKA